MDWTKKRPFSELVLNKQQTDVVCLGGRMWTKIPKYSKKTFMNVNKIQILQKQRNDGDLGADKVDLHRLRKYPIPTLTRVPRGTNHVPAAAA